MKKWYWDCNILGDLKAKRRFWFISCNKTSRIRLHMHANPSLHNEKKETTAIIFCEIMMDAQLHGCMSAKK